MLIEIDQNRYEQVSRRDMLDILVHAHIAPDDLTAHRDRTFTAYYNRERVSDFRASDYVSRIEDTDYRVAIFKHPNPDTDNGKYLTLRLAVANPQNLDIYEYSSVSLQDETGSTALLSRLKSVSRDMRQLVDYAHEIADNGFSHKHLTITLGELEKQIDLLTEGLHQLTLARM